jgi:hypothetical protein
MATMLEGASTDNQPRGFGFVEAADFG